MPIALALVAGGLATVNPCGFALLPALLSFYVGAEEESLPRAPTRALQGLIVGLLVTAGFLSVFAAIGIPITYGATQITKAIPWAGIAIGAVMAVTGVIVFSGKHLSLSVRTAIAPRRERRARTMFLFGMAYAVASLGCTLPIFLALIGASLATTGAAAGLVVFGSYGLGMAIVLMALSVGAAFVRGGLARTLKRVVPYMNRVAGALLVVAGAYLTYYWARLQFFSVQAFSEDPLVGVFEGFTAWVQRTAASGGGRELIMAAGLIVAITWAVALWRWSGRETVPRSGAEEPDSTPTEEKVHAASGGSVEARR